MLGKLSVPGHPTSLDDSRARASLAQGLEIYIFGFS